MLEISGVVTEVAGWGFVSDATILINVGSLRLDDMRGLVGMRVRVVIEDEPATQVVDNTSIEQGWLKHYTGSLGAAPAIEHVNCPCLAPAEDRGIGMPERLAGNREPLPLMGFGAVPISCYGWMIPSPHGEHGTPNPGPAPEPEPDPEPETWRDRPSQL